MPTSSDLSVTIPTSSSFLMVSIITYNDQRKPKHKHVISYYQKHHNQLVK